MRRMERDEWRAFLSEGTRTAKAAVVRRDGSPHVAPIWFVLDGEDVVFTTFHTSLKARCLRRDPRISLCVDVDRPPYSYVEVRGRATLDADRDELRRMATRIGARYMGEERAGEYGARNGVEGEYLVRVTPAAVVAWDGIAD